jgi:signal transduction histidine kinase
MRERKDDIVFSNYLIELSEYYANRWLERNLRIEPRVIDDFKIRANVGRLTQVFDNLILNSEYWLLRRLDIRDVVEGVIGVTVDAPIVTVEDNGLGFHESIADLAFDPFVTMKPDRQGRGLGLFVVRQLLDSMNATIHLSHEKNSHGRRYRLLLDFSRTI